MTKCAICNKDIGEYDSDNGMHFTCVKQRHSSSPPAPTGGATFVTDPSSAGAIGYRLVGKLSTTQLTQADSAFLWGIASAAHSGLQHCGTKGKYCHASDGASRMAKKGRTIMTVFYTSEGTGKIAICGIGEHIDGKGKDKDSSYKAVWQDGTKTSFALGKTTDL
ncbi:MAG: hypothetical protein JY451_05415 [Erythrobacter sp.]|nr:MAG: hypothetical protein JY451_05415 [Erythrobacter sp.]